jgi:acetyl-CoA C-acetyltransferase
MMTGALTCPFGTGHMGVTAENVAAEYGITRADQDAFRAGKPDPRRPGHCRGPVQADQIVPVEIGGRKGPVTFAAGRTPQGHQPGGIGGLASGLPEGRHGDGRQCLGHQRRRGGAGAVARRKAAAAPGSWAMPCGR